MEKAVVRVMQKKCKRVVNVAVAAGILADQRVLRAIGAGNGRRGQEEQRQLPSNLALRTNPVLDSQISELLRVASPDHSRERIS